MIKKCEGGVRGAWKWPERRKKVWTLEIGIKQRITRREV